MSKEKVQDPLPLVVSCIKEKKRRKQKEKEQKKAVNRLVV